MRVLDLMCCQGAGAVGYRKAGLEVVGVDIVPQPLYPYEFVQADALAIDVEWARTFDLIHASPPCQPFSPLRTGTTGEYLDLVEPTRALLHRIGRPYVIENVPGAPLWDPVVLCGASFGLRVYRHRLFEIHGFDVPQVTHRSHQWPIASYLPALDGEFLTVTGNGGNFSFAQGSRFMGLADTDFRGDKHGLAQGIPPAYTEHIGRAFVHSARATA